MSDFRASLRDDRAHFVDLRPPSSRQDEGGVGQLEEHRALGGEAARGLPAQDGGIHPGSLEANAPAALFQIAPLGCDQLRLCYSRYQRDPDVDEDDLAFRVAVSVALLVRSAEALDEVGSIRPRGARN